MYPNQRGIGSIDSLYDQPHEFLVRDHPTTVPNEIGEKIELNTGEVQESSI